MKLNCWEAKKCGREPGGENEKELGTCPASMAADINGINGGINGGRACWAVSKTLCGNRIQGSFSQKLNGCLQCDFYSAVRNEEKERYVGTAIILAQLSANSQNKQTMPSYSSQGECRYR